MRSVMMMPHVLVGREVRGVLLQAAAAGHVAQPVAVAALAAAAAAVAAAAAAEHRATGGLRRLAVARATLVARHNGGCFRVVRTSNFVVTICFT